LLKFIVITLIASLLHSLLRNPPRNHRLITCQPATTPFYAMRSRLENRIAKKLSLRIIKLAMSSSDITPAFLTLTPFF